MKKMKIPEKMCLIRQNVNLLEFPIWSINKDDKRGVFSIETEKGIYTYTANPLVGIPDATDMNILYFLINLTQQKESGVVCTTFYEICKMAKFIKGGKMYERIEKSLEIWSNVTIKFNGNYCHPQDGHIKMWFHIFEPTIEESKEKRMHVTKNIKIEFNKKFIESLNVSGLFNLIDFNLYLRLKNPLSKRLYEYLPKHFADNKNEFKISDGLLFDKLRLKKRIYKSEIIRQFESISRALIIYNNAQDKHKFSFSYIQKKDSKTDFLCVFTEDKSNVKVNKSQQLPKSKTDKIENKTIKETKTKSNIDKELLDQLLNYGLKKNQINDFLNNPDIGLTAIEEGFAYFKKQLDAGKVTKNQSGYLANAISKGWGERSEEQKKIDDKENFNKTLNKKIELFEQWRFHGLKREDLERLKDEIADMYEDTNPRISETWREKDIDWVML